MGTCERMLRVEAPADVVWGWMSDPRNLFRANMLHAEVLTDETELRKGAVITIDHDFFGSTSSAARPRSARSAPVRRLRRVQGPEVPGRDPFPHQQSFRVVPVDDDTCVIVNSITGRYVFPGAGLLGERLFDRYMPAILDDDNQVVAVGCGAMPPTKVRRPPGLMLWPMMVIGARFVKKSTRRKLLEDMKAQHAAGCSARALQLT